MDFKSFVRETAGGKAIPAHPALLAGEPELTVRSLGRDGRVNRQPLGQREAARHLDAYGGKSDSIDWVMNCVKLIAETGSSAAWHFEKDGVKLLNRKGPNDPKDGKEAPESLVKLFEEPNPYMDWAEFLELTLIDYLLVGNAYWFKWRSNDAGQPIALYRLSPAHVKIISGEFGVDEYHYQLPTMPEALELPPAEIVHFRQANPHNSDFGLGHIQGGARMLDLEIALTDTQASYYEKHAQPSMVIQSERRVPDAVFKKLKGQLRNFYSGPKNAGNLMVLEAGLKYQSVTPSAHEAGFETISKMSRDRILALFRVPGALLGINGGGTDSASNVTSAQRVFDTKTMRPLLDKLQKAVSRHVTKAWDLDFIIEYDYIMPIEDRIKLTSAFAAIPGVKLGEVREYAGLPLLGDERDDMVLNLPGEEVEEGGHPEIADRNLTSEGGRPPNGENTAAFPDAGGKLPASAKVSRKSMTPLERIEAKAIKLEDPVNYDTSSRIIGPSDVLKTDREAIIDNISADLAKDLRDAGHALERSLLDHVEGKAGGTVYQRIKNSEAWKTFTESVNNALERASKRALSSAVIQQSRVGIRPDEELDYDEIAKSLIHDKDIGGASIVSTFKKSLAAKILEKQQKQGTQKDMEQIVTQGISEWQKGKADVVALTNLTHAYNEGVLTALESAGESDVYVFDGDDQDQPCIDANGSVWTIEEARRRRIEHPNCRRAFSALTA